MKRLLALASLLVTLPVLAALTSSRPALPGPGGVVDAHVRLFAALDRGDADAAAAFFTRTKAGMELTSDGKFRESPGAQFFVPAAAADPAQALAQRFAGGTTKVLSGWSDCPDGDLSWASLELEHTPKGGTPQRWHSTSLVRHGKDGFRLWYWHLAPVAGAGAAVAGR